MQNQFVHANGEWKSRALAWSIMFAFNPTRTPPRWFKLIENAAAWALPAEVSAYRVETLVKEQIELSENPAPPPSRVCGLP